MPCYAIAVSKTKAMKGPPNMAVMQKVLMEDSQGKQETRSLKTISVIPQKLQITTF